MRPLLIVTFALYTVAQCIVLTSCASKETSESAREKIDKTFEGKEGVATKAEFIEHFGTADWCRSNEAGEETCRFYRKMGTEWVGKEGRDKKAYTKYDEAVVEFNSSGILKSYKTRAQR